MALIAVMRTTLFFFFFCTINFLKANQSDTLFAKLNCPELSPVALSLALQAHELFYDTFHIKDTITIIDFSKTSDQKRLFVIDLKQKMMLFSEITTHGANSGLEKATDFSNRVNSYKSSLGCFKTAEYDISKTHDTVLILDGLEWGINHNARKREIVIHRSELAKTIACQYCSYEYIDSLGYNGQSFGCPVLRREVYKDVMHAIAGGSMLFAYAEDEEYRRRTILKVE